MTREEWSELYDALHKRQVAGETVWTQTRGGGNAPQFWPKYSAAQNKRWFMDQLKRKGFFNEE